MVSFSTYQLNQIIKMVTLPPDGNMRKDKFLSPCDQQQNFAICNELSILLEREKEKETKRKAKPKNSHKTLY